VPEKRQKTADCLAILPLFSYRRRLVNRKSNNSNPGFGELMILRNKTVSLRLSVAASICLLAQSAWAQVPDNDKLDEIVVTATRMETTVRNAARSISVVGKERIQLGTQQLGLDEALAAVPGLYMQNRYNFAQDLRVSLRGFGARSSFGIRGIKVIVDGIPETLPDGQAGVDSIDLGSATWVRQAA
jgi:outer membrane receptor for ferrienterochelin and colicin